MTGRKPVSDEHVAYLRKLTDLSQRFLKGALPPDQVLGGLQSLIEGKFGETVVPVTRQKPRLIHGLFVPPEVQLENIRRWNQEREWGFADEDFAKLPSPSEWPEDKLVVVVLVPYLATIQQTFDELWQVAGSRQRASWRWDELLSDTDHLRLLKGVGHRPGLRWEVIDLAANWDRKNGTSPGSVRGPKTSPHAGILACAAQHPKWTQAMDGNEVPYVWLSGYEANIPGHVPWQDVPCLNFGRFGRGVGLDADWVDYRFCDYAVPVFRESA